MEDVKATLRKKLLQKRRSLSLNEWQCKSQQICDHLQAFPLFRDAKTILTYFSFRQEPDLSLLWKLDKVLGVPRCVENSLFWHLFPSDFPTQTGAYGITEPHPEAPIVTIDRVDLILVPCVACDQRGYRLGYGGGFYDRLFSSPRWADKPTIGIVFQFGVLEALAIDPWDRPLQFICTEVGVTASLS
ncbi:5-formyltetrahydrofolate cyclo-ligase [Phormidesmis sp. 146-12]